ncbi:ComF family protein [Christensenellaceae bacterium OttesenSCG-928-K19]|nr:ComF family protein [Christensenellaceae bacterium OttesenSCG-928-K19]
MSLWKDLANRLTQTGVQCVYCGREITQGTELCPDCEKGEQACYARQDDADGVLRVFRYQGVIRKLIHHMKYDDRKDLALFAARRMYDYYCENGLEADVITFVPVHKNRLKTRGFDQSECMAEHLAGLAGVPCHKLLVRVKNTAPQFNLSREERLRNMDNAFEANGGIDIAGKRILVIDDIYTTGTTMRACISCLHDAAQALPFVLSRE